MPVSVTHSPRMIVATCLQCVTVPLAISSKSLRKSRGNVILTSLASPANFMPVGRYNFFDDYDTISKHSVLKCHSSTRNLPAICWRDQHIQASHFLCTGLQLSQWNPNHGVQLVQPSISTTSTLLHSKKTLQIIMPEKIEESDMFEKIIEDSLGKKF